MEALGETPAVVRAKATAEAPWRQIDFHDSDLNAAIAHVVDPVSDHRSLPARIDVLEQIAHFLYDNETVDRRGEVCLTEPDEKVTTITGTPKNVLALVAETVTAARGAYGEISWTLDGIDRTGARIVVHSPQSETISPSLPRLAVVLRIWAVFGECEACNLLIIKDRVSLETKVVP